MASHSCISAPRRVDAHCPWRRTSCGGSSYYATFPSSRTSRCESLGPISRCERDLPAPEGPGSTAVRPGAVAGRPVDPFTVANDSATRRLRSRSLPASTAQHVVGHIVCAATTGMPAPHANARYRSAGGVHVGSASPRLRRDVAATTCAASRRRRLRRTRRAGEDRVDAGEVRGTRDARRGDPIADGGKLQPGPRVVS